jgi:hypothetical protein
MPKMGTHRISNASLEDGVWLMDVAGGFEIPESQYVEDGHWPKVASLPWGQSVAGGGLD